MVSRKLTSSISLPACEVDSCAFLVAGEVMEVVDGGAAQMAEHKPEHGLENFLGCRRHAGRVSQAGTGSRIIVNDALLRLCIYQELERYWSFQRRCGNR